MSKGDEDGLFWYDTELDARKEYDGMKIARKIPSPPETGWELPTEFPELRNSKVIAIDIETCDPDLLSKGPGTHTGAYIVGVAVGTDWGYRKYFPIAHERGENLPKDKVYNWLNTMLSTKIPKVGANLLYDLEFLAMEGVKVEGPFWDVQVAEPLIDENQYSFSLENISKKYLGEGKEIEVISQWLRKAFGAESNWKNNIWRCYPCVTGAYAESDVDRPLRILKKQWAIMQKQGLIDLFHMESALIPLLLAMRLRGVNVDVSKAELVSRQMKQGFDNKVKEIESDAGLRIGSIWAAGDIAKVFDSFGLEYPLTEKTKKPSFRTKFLENHRHPIAAKIREARKLEKLRNTFVDGYIIDSHINGKIFGQFHQLKSEGGGTVTGRFSSSLPNLQNIPSRDPLYGPMIRELFIPDDGCKWWKIDYSQIEYRLIVHYACLYNLPKAQTTADLYTNDPSTDFHQVVADICSLPRKDAKNVNFGIAYGQGIKLLCYNLGVSYDEGKDILDQHRAGAPYIRELSDRIISEVNVSGKLRTLLGRYRRFPSYEDRDGKLYKEWAAGRRRAMTHKALNAKIQGSAADVMKKAMVDLHKSGIFNEIGIPHLTVHDELDGSIEPEKVGLLKEVQDIMERCVKLKLPMLADPEISNNWGMKE